MEEQEVVPVTGRILVGVDGSNGSRRALAWALEEAAVHKSKLEAAIVWQSPYDYQGGLDFSYPVDEAKLVHEARARLVAAIDEVDGGHDGVEVEPIVLEGDAAEALCRHAAEADLLVVGSRGHGTFAGLLLGSVGSKCAHHSPRPVVIVPLPHQGDPDRRFRATGRIVVGVDGSDGSLRALRWAVDEARARGAAIQALTVWRGIEAGDDVAPELATFPSVTGHDRAIAERARERLQQLVTEALDESAVVVEPTVLEGDPAEILCRHAAEADLLVVGSRGRGTFAGLLLGSVGSKCAHHGRRPVVIVPTARDASITHPRG